MTSSQKNAVHSVGSGSNLVWGSSGQRLEGPCIASRAHQLYAFDSRSRSSARTLRYIHASASLRSRGMVFMRAGHDDM
jgi:hypothetical protein